MKCVKCDREIKESDNFCSKCRAKQIKFSPHYSCKLCGSNIRKENIYCPNCGIKQTQINR